MSESTRFLLYDIATVRDLEVSVGEIGGKAESLLRMMRAGLPVPPACVIPIQVCECYFAAGKTLPPEVVVMIEATASELQRVTGRTLGAGSRDLQLAVRSGAAESMPGCLESVLRVHSREQLERAVCTVLDSWNSPAAIAFRQSRNLTHLTGTAVIVQQMIDTAVAGLMFTRDPLQLASETLIIEAVRGTGEPLVSGVSPGQRWTMNRLPPEAITMPTGSSESPLLDSTQLCELADIGRQLEAVFGQPVDIEWGLDSFGRWHLFQARPIVPPRVPLQVSNADTEQCARQIEQESLRIANFRREGETLWVRHSLCEAVPYPTPLTWSMLRELMNGAGGYGRLYRALGFSPSRRVCQHGFLELIGGQVYASVARLPDLFCTDFPFSHAADGLRRDPTLLDRAPRRLDLDRVGPWFLLRSPWIAWILLRVRWRIRGLRKQVRPTFHDDVLPKFHAFLTRESTLSASRESIESLLATLRRRIERIFHDFAPQLFLPGAVGAAAFDLLRQSLISDRDEKTADEFCRHLLQHVPIPILQELQQGLRSLSSGSPAGTEFLARFGHRAWHEMELAEPRWREITGQILVAPIWPDRAESSPSQAIDLSAELDEIMGSLSSARRRQELHALLDDAVRLLPYREIGKHEFLRGYELLRQTASQLGKVLGLGDDIYYLDLAELGRIDAKSASSLISARKQERAVWQTITLPPVIDEHGLVRPSQRTERGDFEWQGQTISAGCGEGRAWFPDRRATPVSAAGVVLVSATLPPQIVAGCGFVSAMVVDQSALLSHGAILARQFGIPVVCHPEATQLISENDIVHVDGNTGRVRIVRNLD